ncbi:MAG TPA: DUF4097 family beta strand repeat-containing protein [Pyrinomonadaceae bacterium]|nr:DUF4097 family beta strand repeat-containing protein [Pyrinomonadaceae bacterium]
MADRCNNCGAELFEGQQFCRACGAPTRQFSSEELPTQMLPGQQQPQQPPPNPLSTAPLSGGRNTSDPVYGTNFPHYQPPVASPPAQRHTSPVGVQPQPPARRRSRAWLYVVLALLVFFCGASLLGAIFFANRTPTRIVRVGTRPNVGVPPVPPVPQHPMDADDDMSAVGDEGAEVSGNQTTITKTYPLAQGGSFELHNISGDIRVEGWDEQQAEVKIIKRGGSPEARDALKIVREQSADRLSINTTPEMQASGVEEVRYEVKLPRNLREVEIVSNNSNVVLVGANAASLSVVVQRGNIKLEDVSGTINSRTTKGNTTVVMTETPQGNEPQVFNGISGNIELELSPDVNADLKAETVSGDIEVDEDFGIKVEKRMIGQQAVGRIGKGGQPIVVKTVSGNIKIRS